MAMYDDVADYVLRLTQAVEAVDLAAQAREAARPGSAASYRAALDHRRMRDELGTLIAREPELFAGLLVVIVQTAREDWAAMNERVAKLEALVIDWRDNVSSPIDNLNDRLEALAGQVSEMSS